MTLDRSAATASAPVWITLDETLNRLTAGEEGVASAWMRLRTLLSLGVVRTKADVMSVKRNDADAEVTVKCEVPTETWSNGYFTLVDAPSGYLTVSNSDWEDRRPIFTVFFGLKICQGDVLDHLMSKQPATKRKLGRPPGNFWPHLAEEIAVYVHENGAPDDTAPIAPVIKDILDRLSTRGVDTPSDWPVRGVLENVFKRIRVVDDQ